MFINNKSEKLEFMAQKICNESKWRDLDWLNIGNNVKVTEIDKEKICEVESTQPVTIPFFWDYFEATKTCKLLGNGTIFNFNNPKNLTNFDFKLVFGANFKNHTYFWTPYTDEEEEGVFKNIHNGEIVESLDFQFNQPNGGTAENYIVLSTATERFMDGIENRPKTSLHCLASLKILTMRGFCKHSYLESKYYPVMQNGLLSYVGINNVIIRFFSFLFYFPLLITSY